MRKWGDDIGTLKWVLGYINLLIHQKRIICLGDPNTSHDYSWLGVWNRECQWRSQMRMQYDIIMPAQNRIIFITILPFLDFFHLTFSISWLIQQVTETHRQSEDYCIWVFSFQPLGPAGTWEWQMPWPDYRNDPTHTDQAMSREAVLCWGWAAGAAGRRAKL